jgi:hypothetical protein
MMEQLVHCMTELVHCMMEVMAKKETILIILKVRKA